MKPQIAEADNPLLCESIRRSRAELTLNLLLKFKDNHMKLRLIIDALLGHSSVEMYNGVGPNSHSLGNNSSNRISESHVTMASHCMNDEDALGKSAFI